MKKPNYQIEWHWKNVLKISFTVADYDRMLIEQNGGCAICGHPPKTRRLNVDHDHKTGRVRGLLCWQCNNHIVSVHTLQTARKLVEYLEKYENN